MLWIAGGLHAHQQLPCARPSRCCCVKFSALHTELSMPNLTMDDWGSCQPVWASRGHHRSKAISCMGVQDKHAANLVQIQHSRLSRSARVRQGKDPDATFFRALRSSDDVSMIIDLLKTCISRQKILCTQRLSSTKDFGCKYAKTQFPLHRA